MKKNKQLVNSSYVLSKIDKRDRRSFLAKTLWFSLLSIACVIFAVVIKHFVARIILCVLLLVFLGKCIYYIVGLKKRTLSYYENKAIEIQRKEKEEREIKKKLANEIFEKSKTYVKNAKDIYLATTQILKAKTGNELEEFLGKAERGTFLRPRIPEQDSHLPAYDYYNHLALKMKCYQESYIKDINYTLPTYVYKYKNCAIISALDLLVISRLNASIKQIENGDSSSSPKMYWNSHYKEIISSANIKFHHSKPSFMIIANDDEFTITYSADTCESFLFRNSSTNRELFQLSLKPKYIEYNTLSSILGRGNSQVEYI